MRAIAILIGLVIFCALCFNVAAMLSPDAVGMAVGMLFGVLAGIPTALLMMASNRQRPYDDDEYRQSISRYSDAELAAHGIARERPIVIVYPSAEATRIGWPEHISAEDAHLYSYELSAYGNQPIQTNKRRRGPLPPLPPLPSGYRPDRANGEHEELDEPWMR